MIDLIALMSEIVRGIINDEIEVFKKKWVGLEYKWFGLIRKNQIYFLIWQ